MCARSSHNARIGCSPSVSLRFRSSHWQAASPAPAVAVHGRCGRRRGSNLGQWFALRAAVLRLAIGLWLLPPGRQPASVKAVPGSANPGPALGRRRCAVQREVSAAGLGTRASIGYCPLSNLNGAHMQFQAKVLQAQQSYRQGQRQSQPNHSFKRTA